MATDATWPLPGFIEPDWPAPAGVRALTTTREGGFSRGKYAAFNLTDHVNDDSDAVIQNRALLARAFELPATPAWLTQVHGSDVIQLPRAGVTSARADAAWTDVPGAVCAVLTADCLPVFFSHRDGGRVAVAHAGWRGLLNGVLSATLAALAIAPRGCLVWLGPAIGPAAFEVGDEVREAFVKKNANNAEAFQPGNAGRWLCDICRLARIELEQQGVTHIYGGGLCTFSDAERFYSYRRDGDTGRMASLIWIAA